VTTNGSKYAPVPGKIPGTTINLGGHELVLAPLNLDQVQQFEEQIGKLGTPASAKEALEQAVPIIHASLQRNYEDMTEADVRGLLDVGNFPMALEALVSVSGFVKKGEAAPASR